MTDHDLHGQVQKKVDGQWVDVDGLCYENPDRAFIVKTEYSKRHGNYRVDIRDHPDGVPG